MRNLTFLTEEQRLLEQLKVLGRNPANGAPIFAVEGTETLLKYGFDRSSDAVSREALRCLANAMLLNESTRQTVLDLDYSGKAAERMKVSVLYSCGCFLPDLMTERRPRRRVSCHENSVLHHIHRQARHQDAARKA